MPTGTEVKVITSKKFLNVWVQASTADFNSSVGKLTLHRCFDVIFITFLISVTVNKNDKHLMVQGKIRATQKNTMLSFLHEILYFVVFTDLIVKMKVVALSSYTLIKHKVFHNINSLSHGVSYLCFFFFVTSLFLIYSVNISVFLSVSVSLFSFSFPFKGLSLLPLSDSLSNNLSLYP